MSMSLWSNEECMAFLEAYQSEPSIWDPKDKNHKDKKKVADAWCRLSQALNKPLKELKVKKEILMTTFRKHLKKKKDSMRSGAGIEDIYKPCWFAYEYMESFLLPVYRCNNTSNTEMQSLRNFDELDDEPADEEMDNDTSLLDDETLNTPRPIPSSTQKSRRRPAPDLAEQQMAAAFGQLTNALGRRSEQPPPREEDECDLYGKLLAKRLRDLPKHERQIFMYRIDGLFINRLNLGRETPSPQYSYEYSSNPVVHRPPSTQPYYSQPSKKPSPQYFYSSDSNVHRSPSTQSSYSEPSSSVTAPKRILSTLNPVPLHAKLVPKYRKTSSVMQSPPQNKEENYENKTYAIVHRAPSTQSSYSEPSSSVTAPKRILSTLNPVPLHVKLVPKYRKTSSVMQSPPQNTEENDDNKTYSIVHRAPETDSITLYSAPPSTSNTQNTAINITSDQTIVASSQSNISTEALLNAFQDFESEDH